VPPSALTRVVTGGQPAHDRYRPQDRSSSSGTTTARRFTCFCAGVWRRIVFLFRGIEKKTLGRASPVTLINQLSTGSRSVYGARHFDEPLDHRALSSALVAQIDILR